MTLDQALVFSISLQNAVLKAYLRGESTIDVLGELRKADDTAREELQAALRAFEQSSATAEK